MVESSERELIASRFEAFLRAMPKVAGLAGVSVDEAGNPDPEGIEKVAAGKVYLKFLLEDVPE